MSHNMPAATADDEADEALFEHLRRLMPHIAAQAEAYYDANPLPLDTDMKAWLVRAYRAGSKEALRMDIAQQIGLLAFQRAAKSAPTHLKPHTHGGRRCPGCSIIVVPIEQCPECEADLGPMPANIGGCNLSWDDYRAVIADIEDIEVVEAFDYMDELTTNVGDALAAAVAVVRKHQERKLQEQP